MKVFITGGTGFVGSTMTKRLVETGHEVSVLTRSGAGRRGVREGISLIEGDPQKRGSWQEKVADHDVIINLAGASIFTLWTSKARRTIMDSRVLTTRNLVDALSSCKKGTVLLSASAVGYYGSYEDDRILDESAPPGDDFLAKVGRKWEAEAGRAEAFGVRVALCRFGIVMGRRGGALARMAPAFRKFMGSPLGSGKQWFPWIHEEDLFRIMLFVSGQKEISGPVNCTAPFPVTNEELTRTLAKVLRRPVLLPAVPGFVLRTLLGEFGDVLLKGQRATPAKLIGAGFEFRFPTLEAALRDLLG